MNNKSRYARVSNASMGESVMPTIAEEIGADFQDIGRVFDNHKGDNFESVCREKCVHFYESEGNCVSFTFLDGSQLVIIDGRWDYVAGNCECGFCPKENTPHNSCERKFIF